MGDAYGAAMDGAASEDGGVASSSLPAKYADPSKSDLKREVVAEGENKFTFELTE